MNGYVKTNSSTTCASACADKSCCVGEYACDGFTGKVCKNEVSCNGFRACYNAYITFVAKSCNGDYSCYYAEQLGSVINSCKGFSACSYAGIYSGTTRDIQDSCNDQYACAAIAYYGTIGNIASSCNNNRTCLLAGSALPNGTGAIYSSLTGCCNSMTSECEKTNQTTLPAECFVTQVRVLSLFKSIIVCSYPSSLH